MVCMYAPVDAKIVISASTRLSPADMSLRSEPKKWLYICMMASFMALVIIPYMDNICELNIVIIKLDNFSEDFKIGYHQMLNTQTQFIWLHSP